MEREEEIIQLLREIKDAQVKHHTEWQEAVQKSIDYQKQVGRDITKAKRKSIFVIVALLAILLFFYYIMPFLSCTQLFRSSPLTKDFANPVATPVFDGKYELNAEKSFSNLDSESPQVAPEDKANLEKLLAERFGNFRIDHGVIRAGRIIIQEFRIIKATTNNNTLEGQALYHEDIYDPGDSCGMNVRLILNGDELEFTFSEDGESIQQMYFRKKG